MRFPIFLGRIGFQEREGEDYPTIAVSVDEDYYVSLEFGTADGDDHNTYEIVDVIALDDVEGEQLCSALVGALGIIEQLRVDHDDAARTQRVLDLMIDNTRRQVFGLDIKGSDVVELTGLIAAQITDAGGDAAAQFRAAGLV